MKDMIFNDFWNNCYDESDSFLVDIKEEINTEDCLFILLNKKFDFPSYFGFNWNAVWDLFNDLSWIRQKHIILIHRITPQLAPESMSIYIDILAKTVNSWKADEEHSFDVIFPAKDKSYVLSFLDESDRQ